MKGLPFLLAAHPVCRFCAYFLFTSVHNRVGRRFIFSQIGRASCRERVSINEDSSSPYSHAGHPSAKKSSREDKPSLLDFLAMCVLHISNPKQFIQKPVRYHNSLRLHCKNFLLANPSNCLYFFFLQMK